MNSERVVSTLPIHPIENPGLFFMLSPFVADLVARLTDEPLVLPINITGLKVSKMTEVDKEALVKNHTRMLARFGIIPFSFWRDDNKDFQSFVNSTTEYLHKKCLLKIATKTLTYCDCGALELPVEYLDKEVGGKVYTVENNVVKCKVCKQEAHRDGDDESLYLTLPQTQKGPRVYPTIYLNDIKVKIGELANKEIRISRRHKTDFQVILEGKSFFIDTDFAWELLGSNLDNLGKVVDTWVISSRTIRKGVLVALLQEILTNNKPNLLVTPYIKNSLKLNSTIERYGVPVTRAFMLGHLEWSKKETEADTALFYWILRAMEKMPNFQNQQNEDLLRGRLEQFTAKVNKQNVLEMLKQCRSEKEGIHVLLLPLIK